MLPSFVSHHLMIKLMLLPLLICIIINGSLALQQPEKQFPSLVPTDDSSAQLGSLMEPENIEEDEKEDDDDETPAMTTSKGDKVVTTDKNIITTTPPTTVPNKCDPKNGPNDEVRSENNQFEDYPTFDSGKSPYFGRVRLPDDTLYLAGLQLEPFKTMINTIVVEVAMVLLFGLILAGTAFINSRRQKCYSAKFYAAWARVHGAKGAAGDSSK